MSGAVESPTIYGGKEQGRGRENHCGWHHPDWDSTGLDLVLGKNLYVSWMSSGRLMDKMRGVISENAELTLRRGIPQMPQVIDSKIQ